jgi:hypothetical protein
MTSKPTAGPKPRTFFRVQPTSVAYLQTVPGAADDSNLLIVATWVEGGAMRNVALAKLSGEWIAIRSADPHGLNPYTNELPPGLLDWVKSERLYTHVNESFDIPGEWIDINNHLLKFQAFP